MADQAKLIGLRRPQLGGLADIRRRHRFGVFAPRTMAGFARLAVEAAFLIGFHGVVRILLKRIEDVLVAPLGSARRRPCAGLAGRSRRTTTPARRSRAR